MKCSAEKLLLMDPIEVYKLRLNGEISRFPKGFLTGDKQMILDIGIKLLKYLIEEELKWVDEEVCENLSSSTFRDYGLGRIFEVAFCGSPYKALNYVYPDKYKPWQLKSVPRNFWNKETGAKATIWLFEEKLGWTIEEICEKVSISIFQKNKLDGMLMKVFNGSPYRALENAYPGKFKPCKFDSTSKIIGIELMLAS